MDTITDNENEYIPAEFKDEMLKVLMAIQKEKFEHCNSINIFGNIKEIKEQAEKNHAKLVMPDGQSRVSLSYIMYRATDKDSDTVYNFIGTDVVPLKNFYVIPQPNPDFDPRKMDDIYVNLRTGEAIRLTKSTEYEKVENSFKAASTLLDYTKVQGKTQVKYQ